MMPPEQVKLKIMTEWLRKADADMKLAEHLVGEGVFFSAAAFHSQQAAEKYLKGFLAWWQIDFPRTHDLEKLLDLVATVAPELAGSLREIIILSPYGVELRYPGDRPEATPPEARQAVALACKVRGAILPLLPGPLL